MLSGDEDDDGSEVGFQVQVGQSHDLEDTKSVTGDATDPVEFDMETYY